MRRESIAVRNPKDVLLALSVLACSCTGCSSIWCHTYPDLRPGGVYLGTREDVRILASPPTAVGDKLPAVLAIPFTIIDLPFSALLDTALLPADLKRRNTNAPPAALGERP